MDIVKTIVGATVILIMVGMVVVPIVGSMENAANNRFSNDTTDGVRFVMEEDGYDATITKSGDVFVWSDTRDTQNNGYIITDTLIVSLNYGRTNAQCVYTTGDTQNSIYLLAAGMNLTISGNTWTIVSGTTTYATNTFNWALVSVDSGGDYYMPPTTGYPVKVTTDADVYVWNENVANAPAFVAHGPIDDIDIDFQYLPQASTFTALTAVTATSTEGEYNDSLSAITLTQTEGDPIAFNNHTIVPILYQNGPSGDPIVTSLIGLTPVLLIVGLIVGIFGVVFYRKSRY